MSGFDAAVVLFLNRFAQASWSFDHLVDFLSTSNLFKGGVITATLWGLWFAGGEENESNRSHVIATVLAAIVAIAVARTLALKLPFRVRPIHDDDLAFVVPHGTSETRLEYWSAFPSDHAVLFFALAAGIWFISRTAGLIATVYVMLVIALPRIYLGLHYPTDILLGALIGTAIAAAANTSAVRERFARPALRWMHASPVTFYAFFFLVTFQIAVLFHDGRQFGSLLYYLLSARFF